MIRRPWSGLLVMLTVSGLVASCTGADSATTGHIALAATSTTTSTTTTIPVASTTTTTTPAPPTTATATSTATEIPDGADLYADPPVPTGATPGDLLRYQRIPAVPGIPVTNAPGDLWRVMYTSTDAIGAPIVVTGMVRVPNDRPVPADGWPVITWAHGTTGTSDRCAPSRQLDYPPVPDPLVSDGYVIASTDYAGIGTPGLHPYFDGGSEARAVLDIVTAAGHLPGVAIARPFAVWGHSQGGHAALFARQLAAERLPGHDLVGTVALAPPSLLKDAMTAILAVAQPKGLAAMVVAGIAATHPDARLSDILVPPAISAILQTVETGCSHDVDQAFRLFGTSDIVVANLNATEPWATYLQDDEPALAPGTGPLLLVHALDDATVPPAMSLIVKDRTCSRGEPTLRWALPRGGHNGIVDATRAQDRQWTLDRFAGVAPPTNCGQPDGAPPA